jgi:uncharacterized Zn finger protein
MGDKLDHLTQADIQARCTEASFERGRRYATGGAVRQRVRLEDGLEARVAGTYTYRVTIRGAPGRLIASCTCPYDWGGDCKHIVATLLAWLHEPESFRASADLRAALAARGKEELVDILVDICAVYPHLVDEFGLLGEAVAYDPESVVAEIFAELEPPGSIDEDEAVARMETVARHADRLARQGQEDVARRIYYILTLRCKNFSEDYGSHEIFPMNIPYDFAVAYRDLALDQLEEHTNAIEQEVRDMLRGDWAPEMLGIEEPLLEVWAALGL